MPRYKRVKTNHQEPRDTSITHLCRGRRWEVMGRLAQWGEPQKGNRYPLRACRPCKKSGRGWTGSGYFQNGWGPGARVRPIGLGRVKCKSFQTWPFATLSRAEPTAKKLAGTGVTTEQKRKTGIKKRQDPDKRGGRKQTEHLRKEATLLLNIAQKQQERGHCKSEKLPWTSF